MSDERLGSALPQFVRRAFRFIVSPGEAGCSEEVLCPENDASWIIELDGDDLTSSRA